MANSSPSNTLKILTEEDILQSVREVVSLGFGRIEIIVQDGYIHVLYKGITQRGAKPPRVDTSV
jgi:hypothetical protein